VLAIVHEILTRRALGLEPGSPVSAEQQQLWLTRELEGREYEEYRHPWSGGVVARSGELAIARDDFATYLRTMIPQEEVVDACYHLLLGEEALRRMPDLAPTAVSQAVEEEIGRRRELAQANPLYEGVGYERLLDAQGLSIEALRHDPSVRIAALSHLWIDRSHDDQALREVYGQEREFFDGLYGEGIELFALYKRISDETDPSSVEETQAELTRLRAEMEGLEDFKRLAAELSEDSTSAEQGGRLGVVTRGSINIPATIRSAAFEVLDEARGQERDGLAGSILGPLRIQGGAVLLCLGQRRPPPTWEGMAKNVHRELRRRFIEELLPRSAVTTWMDSR